ncbi:unnamed protein product, partial [Linum tenue]
SPLSKFLPFSSPLSYLLNPSKLLPFSSLCQLDLAISTMSLPISRSFFKVSIGPISRSPPILRFHGSADFVDLRLPAFTDWICADHPMVRFVPPCFIFFLTYFHTVLLDLIFFLILSPDYRLCRFSLSATPGSAVFAYRRLLALPISPIRDSGFYRLDLLRPPYDFPHGGLVSRTSMDGSREKLPRAQTMSVFIYKCR